MIVDIGNGIILDINESDKHIGYSPTKSGIELQYDNRDRMIEAAAKLVKCEVPFIFINNRIILTQIHEIGDRSTENGGIIIMI